MTVRRHPPAVDYRAPGTDPCRVGLLLQSLNSAPRRLSFYRTRVLFGQSLAVLFRARAKPIRIPVADCLPQSPQPVTGPGEFDTENRQPDRDHHDRWAGRYDHHQSQQQHGGANDGYDNAASSLIGNVHDSLDQDLPHSHLPGHSAAARLPILAKLGTHAAECALFLTMSLLPSSRESITLMAR